MPPKKQTTNIDDSQMTVTITETDEENYNPFQQHVTKSIEDISRTLGKISQTLTKVLKYMTENVRTEAPVTQVSNIDPNNLTMTLNAINDLVDVTRQQQPILLESNQITLQQEACKIKSSLSNIWNVNLSKRRQEYWQHLRNENQRKTYEEWKKSTPIILPQKLQMKEIQGEPDDQRRKRERQVLDNYRTEIELLELRSQSHAARVKQIDDEMDTLFGQKTNGQREILLKKLWRDECNHEEEISNKRWQSKNAVWLKKYAESFIKEYDNKNPFIKTNTQYTENTFTPETNSRFSERTNMTENNTPYRERTNFYNRRLTYAEAVNYPQTQTSRQEYPRLEAENYGDRRNLPQRNFKNQFNNYNKDGQRKDFRNYFWRNPDEFHRWSTNNQHRRFDQNIHQSRYYTNNVTPPQTLPYREGSNKGYYDRRPLHQTNRAQTSTIDNFRQNPFLYRDQRRQEIR
jgi:hypothetical protein